MQVPVPPTVVHGFADVNPPGPVSMVKLIACPSGAFAKPRPVVHVHVSRERVRRADGVDAVRRDLDVRVDDPQRLTRHRPRLVDRVALVVRLEGPEARRVHREREAGRVELAARVQRADAPRVRRRRPGAVPFRNQSMFTFPVGSGLFG